ncbi:MAG TPA: aminotransferase class I/II-fold pyridoxal phosphate-dependent enzyme [Ornithinimicrobium sp.]|uniref:aminotransferase class I/II-fold pyridoxal phosphate-dependent enzyme n=1 Tax=Ornithinimicrobium sp. TaxID=1977084 RepID=UPI002B476BC0|nr:aminotransferase class I/II-fold pyridoxal phosphate-dependent enzyme [Ornithinimicrobium sp.]HKJ11827.1 aminotransferase class I/II-fold pyridoxal phosphate-dependent enzyme [Ornithinimicrobium sp.]
MRTSVVSRMQPFGRSVFGEMTRRALEFDAVNLGQGFPDSEPLPQLRALVHEAIEGGKNQYAPARGMPVLREAVAEHQHRFYGLELDPAGQVLVTVGATEALTASVLALVENGEEVITFDPSFDIYRSAVSLAGGVHRAVPLRFPQWELDPTELEKAVGPHTRLIVLNNPHNPTGKVFSDSELRAIADIAIAHDLLVVTDEVYEHLVYDDLVHRPLATLPGMAERTLTISSGGKTFSATGWKVGWVTGPAALVKAVATVKQGLTFTASGPFQPAIAHGLRLPDDFFAGLAQTMARRRDLMTDALADTPLSVAPCAGGYFVVVDTAPLGVRDAVQFCWDLPEQTGVVGVPVSAFCSDEGLAPTLVRLAICKDEAVLREGARRLGTLGRGSG